jgi:transcriptional regulator with XRE-family HTH domain
MGDDIRLGRMVLDVRMNRNMSQEAVAARANVSRGTVSRLERGLASDLSVAALRAISRALEMPSMVALGWRTPELERIRDRLHAAMVEEVASLLSGLGWEIVPESSFNHFGERGAADILAWHSSARALLIVEAKTRLWDLQAMLVALDRKRRVFPGLVERDRGWRPGAVGVILAMPEMSTHRHVVERHRATFAAAFPQRQRDVAAWLADPRSDLRGLWFLPIERRNDIGKRFGRRRASKRRSAGVRTAQSAPVGAKSRSKGPNPPDSSARNP